MDVKLVERIETFLHLTSVRESLVANNIANIDTPGYHTRDINFRDELRRAEMSAGELPEPAVHNVPGLLQRPDGNNVDMDREALLLAQLQLQYSLGVQLIRQQFKRLQTAITQSE